MSMVGRLRPPSRDGRSAARAAVTVVFCASTLFGCTAIATSPSWTGGGMAVSAPVRIAAEDERIDAERSVEASQPKRIGAKHILVMHAASQRKPEGVTRSRDEARVFVQQCLLKIRSGEDFDKVVGECSDEPGAAERNGDLGLFERSQMVKAFADAAFALKIGEVSEVVESPYGFHVIKRTE